MAIDQAVQDWKNYIVNVKPNETGNAKYSRIPTPPKPFFQSYNSFGKVTIGFD